MPTNIQVKLARRPAPGLITKDCFRLEEGPVPEPGPDELRVRVKFVSLDPAMRGWVNEGRSYVPPVGVGEVMRAYAAGFVEASNHPDYKAGDAVQGLFGVQQVAVVKASPRVVKVDVTKAPLERWVGGLGMPGWTAYFGLLEVGQPKHGETVVVSAASGAVGSVVGQIARIKGCRAVGIAGGPEKCRFVKGELGFDECVDYKAADLPARLAAACPKGIDVNFENVGGEVLDAILPLMNTFGRVAVCGLIAGYNATAASPGPQNFRAVLTQRLKVQGLIVSDWAPRIPEAISQLGTWHAEGRLKLREDVRRGGLASFVETLNLLYTGGNNGKLVLEV
jgi:hypothetical protein